MKFNNTRAQAGKVKNDAFNVGRHAVGLVKNTGKLVFDTFGLVPAVVGDVHKGFSMLKEYEKSQEAEPKPEA